MLEILDELLCLEDLPSTEGWRVPHERFLSLPTEGSTGKSMDVNE